MTDIEQIYTELEENGVDIFNIRLKGTKAASMGDNNGCSIAVDENQYETSAELKTVLLHEQTHCEMGTFYIQNTPKPEIARLEYRTDRRIAETKITKEAIDKAHQREGISEVWEFAEYFNVTTDFMKRIMCIHFDMEFME